MQAVIGVGNCEYFGRELAATSPLNGRNFAAVKTALEKPFLAPVNVRRALFEFHLFIVQNQGFTQTLRGDQGLLNLRFRR
jgi:hypothetical protein